MADAYWIKTDVGNGPEWLLAVDEGFRISFPCDLFSRDVSLKEHRDQFPDDEIIGPLKPPNDVSALRDKLKTPTPERVAASPGTVPKKLYALLDAVFERLEAIETNHSDSMSRIQAELVGVDKLREGLEDRIEDLETPQGLELFQVPPVAVDAHVLEELATVICVLREKQIDVPMNTTEFLVRGLDLLHTVVLQIAGSAKSDFADFEQRMTEQDTQIKELADGTKTLRSIVELLEDGLRRGEYVFRNGR